jgi:hypothetical protein
MAPAGLRGVLNGRYRDVSEWRHVGLRLCHSANGVFQIRGDEPKRRTLPGLQKTA